MSEQKRTSDGEIHIWQFFICRTFCKMVGGVREHVVLEKGTRLMALHPDPQKRKKGLMHATYREIGTGASARHAVHFEGDKEPLDLFEFEIGARLMIVGPPLQKATKSGEALSRAIRASR